MSAPQTDIERQIRWHRWPLIGIGLALLVSTILGVLIVVEGTDDTEGPRTPPVMIDGRTGEEVDTAPPAAPPAADAEAPATLPAD